MRFVDVFNFNPIIPYALPPLYALCPVICARPYMVSMFCAVFILSSSAVCEIYVNISSDIFAITVNSCPNGEAEVKTDTCCPYFVCKNATACSISSDAFNLVLLKNDMI